MPHGGPRLGAGRKPKSRNRLSTEARKAAKATGELPHEFLLRVSRGESIGDYLPEFKERIDAAKWAAPYFAPKLSSTEMSADLSVKRDASEYTDAELLAIIERGKNG